MECRVILDRRLQTVVVSNTESVEELLKQKKCDIESCSVYQIPDIELWSGLPPCVVKKFMPIPLSQTLCEIFKPDHVILIEKSCDPETVVVVETVVKDESDVNGVSIEPHITRRSRRLRPKTDENEIIVISDECNNTIISDTAAKSVDSFSIKDITLRKQDLATLKPGHWLNDNVINGYMKLLMEHYTKVYITSTFFYTKLSSHGYKGIVRWISKVQLLDYVYIIVPVHLNGNHWTVVCVDIRNTLLRYYDSLGGKSEVVVKLVKKLFTKYMMKTESMDNQNVDKKWRVIYLKEPRQHNTSDCGVYVCQYARYICENLEDCKGPMRGFTSSKIARQKIESELRNSSLS